MSRVAEMVVKTEIQWMPHGLAVISFGMNNSCLVRDEIYRDLHLREPVSVRAGAQPAGGESDLLTQLCWFKEYKFHPEATKMNTTLHFCQDNRYTLLQSLGKEKKDRRILNERFHLKWKFPNWPWIDKIRF